MLKPSPRHRICVADALGHEYLSLYHDPTDEPVAARFSDWPANNTDFTIDTWKTMMWVSTFYFNMAASLMNMETYWDFAFSRHLKWIVLELGQFWQSGPWQHHYDKCQKNPATFSSIASPHPLLDSQFVYWSRRRKVICIRRGAHLDCLWNQPQIQTSTLAYSGPCPCLKYLKTPL